MLGTGDLCAGYFEGSSYMGEKLIAPVCREAPRERV